MVLFDIRAMLKYLILSILLVSAGCSQEPSPPLSPGNELSTFVLASGFQIELVASEPMVQDPVVIKFDEDGRLWVVEMRGFMPDIDGNGEELPVGRVSVLTDTNFDGKMDSSTIFVDSLVLPRALAIVKGGALVVEDEILWYMEDLDDDLKVDKKTIVDAEYGKKGVIEHAPNGLWRGMDNWYYNAKSNHRYRLTQGKWIKEATEFRGQWGISHDNVGRLYYNYNWSQLHTDLVPPNYLSRNPNHQPTSGIDHSVSQDRGIFPIRTNPAINRGYIEGTLNEKGSLIEFTSASAPLVYRGDLLDVVGNVFVCEPTGNLIKRNLVSENGLYPIAENAYQGKEFLASTDERFRPVWLASGPDGALYIADMYRGIIQHGLYMSPYLRETILQRKLDKHINLGRIWRVLPENGAPSKPRMLSGFSNDELVEVLGHHNGWYRDMAQRLLVERRSPEAIHNLQQLIHKSPNYLARLHALWTLEGMEVEEPGIYLTALKDQNVPVQVASMRILEKIAIKNADVLSRLEEAMITLASDETVALQMALTSGIMQPQVKQAILLQILATYVYSPLFRDAVMSSIPNQEYQFLSMIMDQSDWLQYSSNKEIMLETLTASIVKKRDPEELKNLMELIDNDSLGWAYRAIVAGLSIHDTPRDSDKIPLETVPGIFTTTFNDEELISRISRVSTLFTWPGNDVKFPPQVTGQAYLLDPKIFAQGRSLYLTICSNCHGIDGKGLPRFAPPLVRSEWVLGDPKRLALILLHGMEGPIEVNGKKYDAPDILPVMPSFASTSAEDLAAVMTYVRQEWGHDASPIDAGTVGTIRVGSQGKVIPWRVKELLEMERE